MRRTLSSAPLRGTAELEKDVGRGGRFGAARVVSNRGEAAWGSSAPGRAPHAFGGENAVSDLGAPHRTHRGGEPGQGGTSGDPASTRGLEQVAVDGSSRRMLGGRAAAQRNVLRPLEARARAFGQTRQGRESRRDGRAPVRVEPLLESYQVRSSSPCAGGVERLPAD